MKKVTEEELKRNDDVAPKRALMGA